MKNSQCLKLHTWMACLALSACAPATWLPDDGATQRTGASHSALGVAARLSVVEDFAHVAGSESAFPTESRDARAKAIRCTIEILSPEDEVGPSGKVVASASSLPGSAALWVLARREDFDPAWWLQRRARRDGENWIGAAHYGGDEDVNWKFDVGVMAFSAEDDALLDRKFAKMQEANDWRPLRIPAPLCGDLRKVVRSR